MHPEVKNIGLLTLLYAGTTSIFSFKYYILNDTVKILKRWSKSAGNLFANVKWGTSETLRDETVYTTEKEKDKEKENIKPLSVHVPKHVRPINDDRFGHYLAGLIDGAGNFNHKQELVIIFNTLDIYLAYYIKKQIGFGSVKKIKNKDAVLLIIATKKGLDKVINLINGKIRTEYKFNQIVNNILNHDNYAKFRQNFSLNLHNDLKNHWLAGFSDANASFQIKVYNFHKVEIKLNIQINQKEKNILLLIKDFLGGNIAYIKSKDTYCYDSTSFGSAKKVLNYFDYFHLLSNKHVHYLKWRKTYIILQNKNSLNNENLAKILKFKKKMCR